MSRTMNLFGILLILATVAGCSSNLTPAERGMPCSECDYGYVPVKKQTERRVWCVKDGKTLDCKKNPAECPECRKMMNQEPGR